eukprot:1099861-Amorphochlora_amoeboformis.AAC.1
MQGIERVKIDGSVGRGVRPPTYSPARVADSACEPSIVHARPVVLPCAKAVYRPRTSRPSCQKKDQFVKPIIREKEGCKILLVGSLYIFSSSVSVGLRENEGGASWGRAKEQLIWTYMQPVRKLREKIG